MEGRIESYTHSDSITENKGGSLIKLVCQTDFAARTDEFKSLSSYVAKMAYAAFASSVGSAEAFRQQDLYDVFPEVKEKIEETSKLLKEEIKIFEIVVIVI